MLTQIAFALLQRAYVRLADAYEGLSPGCFTPLNCDLMRGVVEDLREIEDRIPDGVFAPEALASVAAMVREAMMVEMREHPSERGVH